VRENLTQINRNTRSMTEQQLRTPLAPALMPNEILRDKAEALLSEQEWLSLDVVAEMTPEDTQLLFHELRVYQIELEMQNEELRRSQLALDAERTRYFDLYDLAPVSYLTLDDHGLILQTNLTAAKLLGFTRSEMVNRPLTRFIQVDDRDVYYLHHKRHALSEEPRYCELRMVKNDGSAFWVQLFVTTTQHPVHSFQQRVVLTDITERKLAEAARHLSDQALQAVAQGVLMTCPQQRILSTNDAFVRITGYVEKDIVGLHYGFLMGPLTDPTEVERLHQCLATAMPYTGEILNYRKDSRPFWNELTIVPVHDAQGLLTHFIGIIRDITGRKPVEAALREPAQPLQGQATSARGFAP
jgi:PAS domain S-box-containing protein